MHIVIENAQLEQRGTCAPETVPVWRKRGWEPVGQAVEPGVPVTVEEAAEQAEQAAAEQADLRKTKPAPQGRKTTPKSGAAADKKE